MDNGFGDGVTGLVFDENRGIMQPTAGAGRLRGELTAALLAKGSITDPRIEAAFRAVPRHLFAPPGTALEAAYADDVIRTKFDLSGTCLSSVSAPWLQAVMIRQAGIRPGMRILEVGSGGYNAALLAEVTGSGGHVVTIDIDPGITAHAASALDTAGYADRVTVITGDAEHPVTGHGPFDAILVTAGAWDIAPAWIHQLDSHGTLVVPLRMNGNTRSIAFQVDGSHLASRSAEVCGFVPMQGTGARLAQLITLQPPGGGQVLLQFEDAAPAHAILDDGIANASPLITWSGVTVANATPFDDLYLWLGGQAPGFCKTTTAPDSRLPGDPERPGRRYPVAILHDGSLACLVTRRLPDGDHEYGAHAYGPHAEEAAAELIGHVRSWDRHRRNLAADAFAYYPAGMTALSAGDRTVSAFRRRHGTLTVTWPRAQRPQEPPDKAGRFEEAG
jgi:protein-L-isoaspartate(D-aspartate) O-methyltransferase